MAIARLSATFASTPQVTAETIAEAAAAGYKAVICHRPDGEDAGQPSFADIAALCAAVGLAARHQPVVSGQVQDGDAVTFTEIFDALPKPVLGYCRTGTRSATLWAMAEAARGRAAAHILATTTAAGYDVTKALRRLANAGRTPSGQADVKHAVVIVGGGAAGIAVAASLKARAPDLDVAIIDGAEAHYYQPGWTMVGAGVFAAKDTAKTMAALIPAGVRWIKAMVAGFDPTNNAVILDGGRAVTYERLIVAPGLKLNWAAIEGLSETLGHNGVTSNYRFDLAPYTWELVKNLKGGRAVFTQPPLPFKCPGAPQKAVYLSADHWRQSGVLGAIKIDFFTAGVALFGVKDFVPALMDYIKAYNVNLHFQHTLTKVDGPARTAWFTRTDSEGNKSVVETAFDMLHVVPPQGPQDFMRASPLVDAAGWLDVDQKTLRHKTLAGVYGLGDGTNTPNSKTTAAARKQAPIVAHNLLRDMGRVNGPDAVYDGYASCPLTVERGRIVLAEFGYGGVLLPSFPKWLINGLAPSRVAWALKAYVLPPLYWFAMLRGREWLAAPTMPATPTDKA